MEQVHLFDEKNNYTDVARTIDLATKEACEDIMDTWTDLGYSPREIHYVMDQAINDLSLEKLLKEAW